MCLNLALGTMRSTHDNDVGSVGAAGGAAAAFFGSADNALAAGFSSANATSPRRPVSARPGGGSVGPRVGRPGSGRSQRPPSAASSLGVASTRPSSAASASTVAWRPSGGPSPRAAQPSLLPHVPPSRAPIWRPEQTGYAAGHHPVAGRAEEWLGSAAWDARIATWQAEQRQFALQTLPSASTTRHLSEADSALS